MPKNMIIPQRQYVVLQDSDKCNLWTSRGSAKHFQCQKHIDICYHIVRETVVSQLVGLARLTTAVMKASYLTKRLDPRHLASEMPNVKLCTSRDEKRVKLD